jgi:hypothetical protein
MRSRRWKRIACAACLSLVIAGSYKALAVPLRGPASAAPKVEEAVLYGRRLLTLGGYQLNASFTPAGRLVCFEIARA